MKDKELIYFIPLVIMAFVLGVGLTLIACLFAFNGVEKENTELKMQNAKLEHQLLELYQEQAEQTKRTAERNGVGG